MITENENLRGLYAQENPAFHPVKVILCESDVLCCASFSGYSNERSYFAESIARDFEKAIESQTQNMKG